MINHPANIVPPQHSHSFITSMVHAVAIDNAVEVTSLDHSSVWSSITKAIAAHPAVVAHLPLTAIFRDWSATEESPVNCRQVTLHTPPFNGWGVQFMACRAGCTVSASDLVFHVDKGAMCCLCICCGWKSHHIRYNAVEAVVHGLSSDLPAVFWHAYPPSPHLLDTFAWVTKDHQM